MDNSAVIDALEMQATSQAPSFRFSGHETFPCRYTWLPKAVCGLQEDPGLFSDENEAMVRLGVGKNMVRAIRFWAEAAEVIRKLRSEFQNREGRPDLSPGPRLGEKGNEVYRLAKRSGNAAGDWEVSEFGLAIFDANGHDPFLQDIKTLWLIHWKLSSSDRKSVV